MAGRQIYNPEGFKNIEKMEVLQALNFSSKHSIIVESHFLL